MFKSKQSFFNPLKGQLQFMKMKIFLLTFGNKEVEHGECHSVPAEHVIATSSHTLNGHPCTSPNYIGMLYLSP